MGITTRLVQIVLGLEMLIFTSLILPFPKPLKKAIINGSSNSKFFKPLVHFFYVLYAMVFLMFVDSLLKFRIPYVSDNIYHIERNFYLSGFTLYLAIVFRIFINTLYNLYKEEASTTILMKQVKNSKNFVDSLADQEKIKNEKINELENCINDINKQITKKDILIKQLKNNQNEYFALSDKYEKLLDKTKRESKKTK